MELKQITFELITACEEAVNRFYQMREEDRDPDFFEEVKPYSDDMHAKLLEWQRLAKEFIRTYDPKYFHDIQIDNVVDATDQFIVQSFYKKTSKKRFIQSVQSAEYTFRKFHRYLEEVDEGVQ